MADVKFETSTEQLPTTDSITSTVAREENISTEASAQAEGNAVDNVEEAKGSELVKQIEEILLKRISDGRLISMFQLGQLYFEEGEYQKALPHFERAAAMNDHQAIFQLGVLHYDGLLGQNDFKKGVEYMMQVATSTSEYARHLLRAAQHNIGNAYYEGRGVRRSDEEAERFWLLAADRGNPNASVRAQCTLGMFYSQKDTLNLKKAAFWHSEACGNGSLESQGALGVMYLTGMGGKQDVASGFICLRDAANRGSIYAMGHLAQFYYEHKLFSKAIETCTKVGQLVDLDQVARRTECSRTCINRGVALAHFYYGRCLEKGFVSDGDPDQAHNFYSLSFQFDPQVTADLQAAIQMGEI